MDKLYSVWLHQLTLKEQVKIKMLEYFKTYHLVYEATEKEYISFGLDLIQVQKIQSSKNNLKAIEEVITWCKEKNIYIVDIKDENYPYYLKQIPDPPIVLFVKGALKDLNEPLLAIVGSRKCQEYGFQTAYHLAKQLAEMGIVICSGMAIGIDGAAHKGALSAGHSIAVLGTGIDECYPRQNANIYREIPEKGCLVTEYFPGTPALPFQFPKRNRIISGMSLGVLVVEANIRSGSLITAHLALDYNRDVFAVPGNITSELSLGTNELIKNGAKCVMQVGDILEELPFSVLEKMKNNQKNSTINTHYELAQQERIVYAYVSWDPIYLDELFKNTQLPYQIVYTSLIQLEIRGLIKRLPGERYVRV